MKAIICSDFNESHIDTIPDPKPDSGEVVISVDRVQLSVTECQLYRGNSVAHYSSVRDRLEKGGAQLFGHEFCGTIVDSANNVNKYTEGDRIYAPGKIKCGECVYCERKYTNLCQNKSSIGFERPGALSELITLPTDPIYKLPDSVSDAEGAALQPLASALLCVMEASIQPGSIVTVIGAGVMGYQCGQLALQMGADEIYIIDMDSKKLSLARKQGMKSINLEKTDPLEVVYEQTNGVGSDTVFEAVGGNQSHGTEGTDPLAQAYSLVRPNGSVVQVGHIGGEITIRPDFIRSKAVNTINPVKGVQQIGPNTNTGALAAQLIAKDKVSIHNYIRDVYNGLDHFEEIVSQMVDPDFSSLGPPQLNLTN